MRGHPIRPLFFFNDTATTEIYTLSLHDALPIFAGRGPPSDHDILARADRFAERLCLPRFNDPGGHIVVEGVDDAWPLSDDEHRGRGDRREDPFEAVPVEWELALHDR